MTDETAAPPLRIERPDPAALPPGWQTPRLAQGREADDTPPPGLRALLALRGETPVARLAYGAREGFAGAPGTTGFVGWYDATDAGAGAALLRCAAGELLDDGAARVVGPLNGSTWARYRLALPRVAGVPDGEPFLGEPVDPPGYADHFERAGFRPYLEYESRIVRAPAADPRVEPAAARAAERGIAFRGIDAARFDEEIRAVHELSLLAFAENPLYTPLGFEPFAAMYAAARPLLDPALVRLAHGADGGLLGFVFAYTDPLSASGPRIVLKTLAAHPAARGLGLGRLLTDAVHRVAAARGAAVIHALMHVDNVSTNISGRSESELFRAYRLYGAERG